MIGNGAMHEFSAAAMPSGAKSRIDFVALTARLEAAPFQNKNQNWSFSANCKARTKKRGLIAALKRCAIQNRSSSATREASSAPVPIVGSSSRGDVR
jgi:hypothetical protein